jgi:UDPglucose--hexose-1-phosphate uridylyltransferase
VTWELRWHPFRGEWVLFTSHRGGRPWVGHVPASEEPPADPHNALAPGGQRVDGTRNPDYRGAWWFTNDLPVFGADAPEPPSDGDPLYRRARAAGTAEVLCYHHDPGRSLASFTDDEAEAVVRLWQKRTMALQQLPDVRHVLIFENRGTIVGTSNPHPHCQIYAGSLVYETMRREAEVARSWHDQSGTNIGQAVLERELASDRIIDRTDAFVACVPWFARFAYEVHVLPMRQVASLGDLHATEVRDLAIVLRDVVARYDRLWGVPMPYILAVHQAPVDGQDQSHFPFHVEIAPPLRAPGLLKHLAGPEVGGGTMTNESDPDEKAAELRAV